MLQKQETSPSAEVQRGIIAARQKEETQKESAMKNCTFTKMLESEKGITRNCILNRS